MVNNEISGSKGGVSMAGTKKVFGLLFASAIAAPVAFMGAASATESSDGVRTLVADGSVQATAACTGPAAFASVLYTVDGVVVPALSTDLPEGASVKVDFTLAPGCDDLQVGLAAYETTTPTWDPNEIENQELFA